MERKLLAAAIIVSVGLLGVPANAAGSTTIDHYTVGPFPDETCGVSGMTVYRGTSVVREGSGGAFFVSGTFRGTFTADNGKSVTATTAGPAMDAAPVINEQAGTVTITEKLVGLPEKLSITNGPTLSLNAGTLSVTIVFEYTGDPDNPVGELISRNFHDVHGPHPELLSDFELFCEVLLPYLQDP